MFSVETYNTSSDANMNEILWELGCPKSVMYPDNLESHAHTQAGDLLRDLSLLLRMILRLKVSLANYGVGQNKYNLQRQEEMAVFLLKFYGSCTFVSAPST